ncbi:TetR/AcrR family transcriptional regulator [Thalassovita sp.]|jgi:AcrR family transcriptional regulator|uniref:TetR/AcrR family transcriptional regulator n=1 Tax=Thalassovita sp. TaxID=1979401 RepID=UPI003B5A1C25
MNETSEKRPRGSRELWLDAAYELLLTDGIDAVKVMPLARRLNMTRTGFYWFFKDLNELHAAVIERWENMNTGNLVARCNAEASNICEALFNVMDCWLDPTLFDSRLDLAIRNWARVDVKLKERLDQADKTRIDAVRQMFSRFGYSEEQAIVRGMTLIYTQIGYISMEVAEDSNERLERVQHYVELFASVQPNQMDVRNFVTRHSHS